MLPLFRPLIGKRTYLLGTLAALAALVALGQWAAGDSTPAEAWALFAQICTGAAFVTLRAAIRRLEADAAGESAPPTVPPIAALSDTEEALADWFRAWIEAQDRRSSLAMEFRYHPSDDYAVLIWDAENGATTRPPAMFSVRDPDPTEVLRAATEALRDPTHEP